jgi:hypothetical protein
VQGQDDYQLCGMIGFVDRLSLIGKGLVLMTRIRGSSDKRLNRRGRLPLSLTICLVLLLAALLFPASAAAAGTAWALQRTGSWVYTGVDTGQVSCPSSGPTLYSWHTDFSSAWIDILQRYNGDEWWVQVGWSRGYFDGDTQTELAWPYLERYVWLTASDRAWYDIRVLWSK